MNRTFLIAALMTFVAIQSASANVVVPKTYTGPGAADFFDGTNGTRSVTFLQSDFDNAGAANTNIVDVDVEVVFAKHTGTTFIGPTTALPPVGPVPSNPFFSEVSFSLQKVGGPTVELINTNSFQSSLFTALASYRGRIVFDQSAAAIVNATPLQMPDSGTAPGQVGFRPVAAAPGLNALNGLNGLGQWNLNIGDSTVGDGLSFYSFQVRITAVPEPTSLGLLGMLVPCAFVRRRK